MEQRKILFKAKRLDNGEWVEGDLIHRGYKTYVYCPHINDRGFRVENEQVDPSTVCQFTGLKDKDGNDVWEGDIVKDVWSGNNYIYEVVYLSDLGAFVFQDPYDKNDIINMTITEFIVIGSKFDRKEGEKC